MVSKQARVRQMICEQGGQRLPFDTSALRPTGPSMSRIVLTAFYTPVPSGIKIGTPSRAEIESYLFFPEALLELFRVIAVG